LPGNHIDFVLESIIIGNSDDEFVLEDIGDKDSNDGEEELGEIWNNQEV
jgi:hypothetical protein